jgi:predicted nucleic acid-binding protein
VRLYLESSALVKLVQHEAESDALRGYLHVHRGDDRVASELVRVEVVRSVLGGGAEAVAHARRQLARLYLVIIDRQVLDQAATLAPGSRLRSLDAIHLATAQLLGSELRSIVTYDARLAQTAVILGLSVAAPS